MAVCVGDDDPTVLKIMVVVLHTVMEEHGEELLHIVLLLLVVVRHDRRSGVALPWSLVVVAASGQRRGPGTWLRREDGQCYLSGDRQAEILNATVRTNSACVGNRGGQAQMGPAIASSTQTKRLSTGHVPEGATWSPAAHPH